MAGDALGEVVVERGQLRLLDLVEGDRELRVLPGELGLPVVLGEVGIDVPGLAGLHPDDPDGEARDEALLGDFDLLAGRGPAVERHAVDRAGVVDRHDVAELDRPLDRHQGRGVLAHRLEGPLEVRVVGLLGDVFDLEPFVRPQVRSAGGRRRAP